MENRRAMDRMAIGRRIGQVRRKAGLSHIEFARKLHTLVLIAEIAEHGIKKADGETTREINIPRRI